jgi:predicted MFS family arabinose efflux permease
MGDGRTVSAATTRLKAGHNWWTLTLIAAAILMVTMGARQSLGLFVSPLNTSTGLGVVTISLAMAIGQFVWGAVQPIAGALADRYGTGRVLAGSILVLAIGCALTPVLTSTFGLMLTMGLLFAAGAGGAGFSVLIGGTAQHVPANKRGTASGVINAGGSFGQFVFAPLVQKLISVFGWAGAMYSLAVLTLAALPLTRMLRRSPEATAARTATETDGGLRRAVGSAFQDRSYILLHAGFFTCGFHIAFLVIHLPSEVGLCGLPASVASWSLALIGLANIAGSLVAGQWVNRYRSKYILFWMYFSRTVIILIYLAAPKTAMTFYIFAIGLGVTWLATVPPTAGVVGKLFGMRYLATLFGLTLLTHQIGAFFGAYLGGIAVDRTGSYLWMWYVDALLALAAALVNLPIREPKIERHVAAA